MKNKFLFMTTISFLLIVTSIMATIAMANANTVKVKAEVLNLRSGPGLAYEVVSQIRKDTRLHVIGEENEWYKVQLNNGSSGWVAGWLVENTDVSAASNSVAIVSSKGGLNVRAKPNATSKSYGTFKDGDQIDVISEQNGWAQIQYQGKDAWVRAKYITIRDSKTEEDTSHLQRVVIRENSINIRSKPNKKGKVIEKANSGKSFQVEGVQGDWYQIKTSSGQTGYIANWVVNISDSSDAPPKSKTTKLSEATIVIDPGHGGNDPGARGKGGVIEKEATLKVAYEVAKKLKERGAKVLLTRESDKYISLSNRTQLANKTNADAFISLHFDSVKHLGESVSGQTTYYNKNQDKELAEAVNTNLKKMLPLRNRGIQYGDFYVIRENSQPALLCELGYLSSARDEEEISSASYRNKIGKAITEGLADYFSN